MLTYCMHERYAALIGTIAPKPIETAYLGSHARNSALKVTCSKASERVDSNIQ